MFFLLRLVGITNPPLEVAHNWRQSAVNTIARNFEEIDGNILYPRFDTAGEEDGVSGTEFPLFNYLIFIFNLLFGYAHWYGRLINLVVSSLGVFLFYRIIRDWFNHRLARYAAMVLLTSLWFTFSRKIMPDTFSLSLVMVSMFYGLTYLRDGKLWRLLVYMALMTLGLLSKIPSLTIAAVMALPLLDGGLSLNRKATLIIASILPLVLSAWWYFYWFDHITTGYQLFSMGPGSAEGMKQLIGAPLEMLDNFYFDALKFSGFVLFIIGLIAAIKNRAYNVLGVLLLSMTSFLLFMLQAGYGFSMHEYYTLPFVPTMAFMAGYGLSMIPLATIRSTLVAVIMIEGVANQQHDFFIKDKQRYKLGLEAFLDAHIGEELIVVNGGQNPQLMYFAHRRGWTESSERLSKGHRLKALVRKGAQYLVWDKNVEVSPPSAITARAENEHFVIFDLSPTNRE